MVENSAAPIVRAVGLSKQVETGESRLTILDDVTFDIAEGENLNHRVLVYDSDAGKFKRGWGGHGIPLSEISNDPVPPWLSRTSW